VIEAVPTAERVMAVEGLADVDGAFLISSVVEIVPVRTVLDIAEFDPAAARSTEIVAAVQARILTKVEPVGARPIV
jgi:branched-subunit amino acid aminotransferase/4-amino-4-deoxychorismate lyase